MGGRQGYAVSVVWTLGGRLLKMKAAARGGNKLVSDQGEVGGHRIETGEGWSPPAPLAQDSLCMNKKQGSTILTDWQ